MGVNFIGALPMDPHVRIGGDTGQPIATFGETDARAKDYFGVARAVMEQAAAANAVPGPTMTISD